MRFPLGRSATLNDVGANSCWRPTRRLAGGEASQEGGL